jgi:hypothetical protein
METWLRKTRRRDLGYSLFLACLALVAGLGAMALVVGLFWFTVLLLVALFTGGKYPSFAWPLALTSVVCAWLFIDSLHSRRDDFSNISLWLLRESIGIGPRLLVEGCHRAHRVLQLAQLDVRTCAEVLAWLATKRHSVSRDELLRAFPDLMWARLRPQLGLIAGVIFLRRDFSRVTLSQPLRLHIRQWQAYKPREQEAPQQAAPEAAEPPQAIEPEKLSSYEILGIAPSASLAEIKVAYRARIKECHPDRFANMDAISRNLAEEWTKALNAAYANLVAERAGKES